MSRHDDHASDFSGGRGEDRPGHGRIRPLHARPGGRAWTEDGMDQRWSVASEHESARYATRHAPAPREIAAGGFGTDPWAWLRAWECWSAASLRERADGRDEESERFHSAALFARLAFADALDRAA